METAEMPFIRAGYRIKGYKSIEDTHKVGISDIRKSSNKDIPEHVARISGMEI
jgi:hypothetical protein